MLYPVAKRARQNRDNVVRLVRDKLYINGQEYTTENVPRHDSPIYGNQGQRLQQNQQRAQPQPYMNSFRQYPPAQNKSYVNGNTVNRFQYQNSSAQNPWSFPRNSPRQDTRNNNSWELPTYNQFQPLSGIDDGTFDPNRRTAGKQKPTSPLDADMSLKKRRETADRVVHIMFLRSLKIR